MQPRVLPSTRLRQLPAVLAAVAWLFAAGPLSAQESPPDAVPSQAALVAALADPASRDITTREVLALRRLVGLAERRPDDGAEALAARFEDDLQWLERLRLRAVQDRPRSAVADPAGWLVRLELGQQELPPLQLGVSFLPDAQLVASVFGRNDERLSAALLPVLLKSAGAAAVRDWPGLAGRLASDARLQRALDLLAQRGRLAWSGPAEAPAIAEDPIARGTELLDRVFTTAVTPGPPDADALRRLRVTLLTALPDMDPPNRSEARHLLRLGTLIDGLNDGHYLATVEGLLAIAAELTAADRDVDGTGSAVGTWLEGRLPALSEAWGPRFDRVDGRLNSVVAAVYDAVIAHRAGSVEPQALRERLADAVVQISLGEEDIDDYFGQPVREPVSSEIDVCVSIFTIRDAAGAPQFSRAQFDGCVRSMAELAETAARSAELAGDPDGPFGPVQVARELALVPWQRVNYVLGYLHDRYDVGCDLPAQPLPSPLEWAVLANMMAWMAEQAPVYFRTRENEARLERMRTLGQQLSQQISDQVDCFAGTGSGVNDPLRRSLDDYEAGLRRLDDGVARARASYRANRLAPGADVDLDAGAGQATAWRPEDIAIGPCDPASVCELSSPLSATRALYGLFSDPYLLAHQVGMGDVRICYDQMAWVDRRSEYVRRGDDNVANYFGRLSFVLRGQYRPRDEGEPAVDLFARRFTSPEEYHYLFAAASEEVLADACPTEWIGTRIVTPLPPGRVKIVPNRLTYLAAARTQPSQLLATNWDRGAEWRDWFVTGIGTERLETAPPPDLTLALESRLAGLREAQQSDAYSRLLVDSGDALGEEMRAVLAELGLQKRVMGVEAMLFQPQALATEEWLRAALVGNDGLLDEAVLRAARQRGFGLEEVLARSRRQVQAFGEHWQAVPEVTRRTGSVPLFLAMAQARLDALVPPTAAPEGRAPVPLLLAPAKTP